MQLLAATLACPSLTSLATPPAGASGATVTTGASTATGLTRTGSVPRTSDVQRRSRYSKTEGVAQSAKVNKQIFTYVSTCNVRTRISGIIILFKTRVGVLRTRIPQCPSWRGTQTCQFNQKLLFKTRTMHYYLVRMLKVDKRPFEVFNPYWGLLPVEQLPTLVWVNEQACNFPRGRKNR